MNGFLDKLSQFNTLELYQWLIENHIILDEQLCSHCNPSMAFKTVNSTSDGCVFRCINTSCRKFETTKNIRNQS